MALIQLATRTGADPRQDYRQIVDEDLLRGHCNGEPLRSFLPADLAALLPAHIDDDKAAVEFLDRELGTNSLRKRLVSRFIEIGQSVQSQVELHWIFLGLDYRRRHAMGMALQRLLVQVDMLACRREWEQAHGFFIVGNQSCGVLVDTPVHLRFIADIVDCVEPSIPAFRL